MPRDAAMVGLRALWPCARPPPPMCDHDCLSSRAHLRLASPSRPCLCHGHRCQSELGEEAVPELFRARRRAYELDQHIVSNDAPAPTRFSPSILTQAELSQAPKSSLTRRRACHVQGGSCMTPNGPGVSVKNFFEREAGGAFGLTNVRNFADASPEVQNLIDPFWTPATDAREAAEKQQQQQAAKL